MKTLKAFYFVFCLVLIFSDPLVAAPLNRAMYYLFVFANLINLVRILRKPSNSPSRVH